MFRALGDLIRAEREKRGWSQAELGRRAGGLNKETVNRLELGANPRLDTLTKISEVLDLKVLHLSDVHFRTASEQLTEDERDVLAMWRAATPRAQQAISALLHDLAPKAKSAKKRAS